LVQSKASPFALLWLQLSGEKAALIQQPNPTESNQQGLYNQADAGGFIKLQALRLRTLGVNRNKK
jgi:argininosuccinate synthase